MEINFTVYGKPFGKQRPRFSRRGRYTTTYTPQQTVDYETEVACASYFAKGDFEGWGSDVPLFVEIHAYYEIPKSYSNKRVGNILNGLEFPVKKPDFDNIAKSICDGVQKTGLISDDAQIVSGLVVKHYTDNSPRVEVRIGEYLEKKEEI